MRFKWVWMSVLFFAVGCASNNKTASTPPQAASAPAASTNAQAKAVPAPAIAKPMESASNAVTCKRGSEERIIDIEAVQPKGCKLWYTRDGKKDMTASSTKGPGHCEDVRDRIRGKLETASFQCSGGSKVTSQAKAEAPKAKEIKKEIKAEATNPSTKAPAPTKAEPSKNSTGNSDSGKKI